MEDKSFGTFTREVREEIKEYINARIEYSRLLLYEKSARITSIAVMLLSLSLVAVFVLLFLSLTAAIFIGDLLHNVGSGYAIVTGIDLIILLLMIRNRKKIQDAIMQKVLISLLEEDEKSKSTGTTAD